MQAAGEPHQRYHEDAAASELAASMTLEAARSETGDRLGIIASTTCAVHCALLPIVILLLPAFGDLLGDERLEWSLLTLAGLIAIWSVSRGFRRHRSAKVFALIAGGLGLLVVGRWLEPTSGTVAAAVSSVIGAGLLVTAHLYNLRLCRGRAQSSSAQTPNGTVVVTTPQPTE